MKYILVRRYEYYTYFKDAIHTLKYVLHTIKVCNTYFKRIDNILI